MGIFYGIAKKYDYRGQYAESAIFRGMALLIPALLHGAYDYIATTDAENGTLSFIGFIVIMFIVSFLMVGRAAKEDRPIY